jgi:hypothetical protein
VDFSVAETVFRIHPILVGAALCCEEAGKNQLDSGLFALPSSQHKAAPTMAACAVGTVDMRTVESRNI